MSHEIFEANPNLEKAFVTADGTPFYQENDAKNHAKTLEEKTLETVYNPNSFEVVDDAELSQEDNEFLEFEAAEKEKEAKAELAKTLADFDPIATKYPEALKLFKALDLNAENEKKDTIYPLLVDAQAKAIEGTNTQV